MDFATIAGLLMAFAMMGGSLLVMGMEGKGAVNYGAFFDPPAIMMVIGGGLGVGLVGFPLRNVLGLPKVIKKVFFHKSEDLNRLIEQMVALAKTARRDGLLALDRNISQIDDPFIALGIQMAVDGTRPEVIEEVMRTEIATMGARHREGKKVLQLMGRCGPAFGMIATLLGLVLMLGNLSDPDSIGPSMAVALIGTLYGALLANLVCIPFTEKLTIRSQEETMAKEIILHGIMGIQSGDSPWTVQQRLNTYLPPHVRPRRSEGGLACPYRRKSMCMKSAPDWMVSYADMITILMAFFAVMYSIAGAKDAKKDVPFMRSLQRQFGKLVGLPTTISAPAGSSLTAKAAAKTTPQSKSPYRGLGGEAARANSIRSGDQVMIGGVIHFDSGTSVLNEQQRQQLQAVAKDLGGNPLKIEIWGHTLGRMRDADGKLGDNWNLAYARCNSTMSYLVSQGIEPRRIRIGVAAQFEPIYVGRDVPSLETNSRVEVFMLDQSSDDGRAETDERTGS